MLKPFLTLAGIVFCSSTMISISAIAANYDEYEASDSAVESSYSSEQESKEESIEVAGESNSESPDIELTQGTLAIEENEEDLAQAETLPRENFFESSETWDDSHDEDLYAYDTEIADQELPEGLVLPPLPGEEIKYKLKLYQSNYHDLHGRADSKIGKIRFKTKLMPNNEIKMEFNIKGEEDALFQAYIDLANYHMELDGGGAVLTQDQKTMMEYTVEHLRQSLIKKFLDEVPVHSLMTMQMLSYWSKSPKGYVHDKREVVEN